MSRPIRLLMKQQTDNLNLGYGANDGNNHSGTYLMTETSNTIDVFLKDMANPDGGYYGASVQLHNTGTYYGTKITGGEASIGVHVDDIDAVVPGASTIKLNAGRVHVAASKELTYDIPVLNSGDCNTLTRSGKWYLANGSINRPIDKNGWLETKLYSTTHCHQTYTTYTGEIYTRMMQAGTWGAWSVLYEDTGWQYWWYSTPNNYAGYRRKNGFVEVSTKSAGGKTIAAKGILQYTLPKGYRPSVSVGCLGSAQDYRGYEFQIIIDPDGMVMIGNLDPSASRTYWAASMMFIPG